MIRVKVNVEEVKAEEFIIEIDESSIDEDKDLAYYDIYDQVKDSVVLGIPFGWEIINED